MRTFVSHNVNRWSGTLQFVSMLVSHELRASWNKLRKEPGLQLFLLFGSFCCTDDAVPEWRQDLTFLQYTLIEKISSEKYRHRETKAHNQDWPADIVVCYICVGARCFVEPRQAFTGYQYERVY